MSELEARLSTMQTAAQQLQQSSDRVRVSVDNANRIVDELLIVGYDSPGALIVLEDYQLKRSVITTLPDTLRQLGDSLQTAHDDIEAAVLASDMPLDSVAAPLALSLTTASVAGAVFRRGGHGRRRITPDAPTAAPTLTMGPAWAVMTPFVAGVNRTLYADWNADKHKLETSTELREALFEQRDDKQRELNALSNRVLTFTPDAKLDTIDRVQSLRADIADLSAQIDQLDTQIAHTRETFAALNERMQRVMPAAGAHLNLMTEMEGGKTAQIVLDNTQDCVHFVASKLPIPPNMATNAYLWNDNVAKLGEYGIQQGKIPLVGSVLVMETTHPYANDVYGHVMYVERVDAQGVWITDNLHSDRPVLLSDLTPETSGANLSYVYFPWHTRG